MRTHFLGTAVGVHNRELRRFHCTHVHTHMHAPHVIVCVCIYVHVYGRPPGLEPPLQSRSADCCSSCGRTGRRPPATTPGPRPPAGPAGRSGPRPLLSHWCLRPKSPCCPRRLSWVWSLKVGLGLKLWKLYTSCICINMHTCT